MKLTCVDEYYKETKQVASGTNFLSAILPVGSDCSLEMSEFTQKQSERRAYLQETV